MMKKIVLLSIMCFLMLNILSAEESVGDGTEYIDSTVSLEEFIKTRETIIIGQTDIGKAMPGMSEYKVLASLYLASLLSDKYYMYPMSKRDSVAQLLQSENKPATLRDIALNLDADYIAFISVNSLANMVRVNLIMASTVNPEIKKYGFGYGLSHFKTEKTQERVYDPALLAAMQRSLALASGDSLMYWNLEGKLKVKPAPGCAIGTINYIDNPKLSRWELFTVKNVSSYDAVESIFSTASRCPDFVFYDIESRDSLFEMFNLYMAENFTAPSGIEIEALYKMNVDYYITGVLHRVRGGAEVELMLCKVGEQRLEIIRSEKGFLENDTIKALRNIVEELTIKLLKIEDVPGD